MTPTIDVADLSHVLSAAHYVTCYSCRVHSGTAGDHVPQVITAAEPQRVRVLARNAARADCGAESMEDDLAWVYATSVDPVHSLAEMMLTA